MLTTPHVLESAPSRATAAARCRRATTVVQTGPVRRAARARQAPGAARLVAPTASCRAHAANATATRRDRLRTSSIRAPTDVRVSRAWRRSPIRPPTSASRCPTADSRAEVPNCGATSPRGPHAVAERLPVTVVAASSAPASDDDDAARRRRRPPPTTTRPPRARPRRHRHRRRRRPPRPPRRRRPPAPLPADPFALGVRAGDPDATSAVLWTRLIAPTARRSTAATWSSRGSSPTTTTSPRRSPSGDVVAARRRRPQRARRRRRRRPVVLPLPRRRVDEPGRPRRAGRRRSGARCASPPRRASTSRPASTPPTATSPSGRPTSSCSSATSSTRAAARPVGGDRRAQPRRRRAVRPRRLPRPLRPVPRPTPTCRRRGRRARGW